jgi:hypothetical protein
MRKTWLQLVESSLGSLFFAMLEPIGNQVACLFEERWRVPRLRASKWRAARFGLDGELILDETSIGLG